jgi:hypothetical protein
MTLPILFFAVLFVGLWLSVRLGIFLRKKMPDFDKDAREDFIVVQGATLTLLGLIIGFSFSMAISRYDQRKNYEEEEANAIGTEFLRVEMLPVAETAKIQDLLKRYLDQRIAFYKVRSASGLEQISRNTAGLQAQMWSVTRDATKSQPTALSALVVSGMNDVLNSQGYTQAAWWNRIPPAAWMMMIAIAFFGALLIGIGVHRANVLLTVTLPLVISVAFFLIADLDSPRRGLIRTQPQNLISLADSLKSP